MNRYRKEPMKPLKTKAQIRAELEAEIAAYEQQGGAVQQVPRGLSGNPHNINLFSHSVIGPKSPNRTLLTDTVKALEDRKHAKANSRPKKPKRVLLKDDFGEPLRWVWEDENK